VYGNSVTLTANVTSSGGPTPSGSLTFLEGSNTLNATTLDPTGAATFTVNVPTAGTHSYTGSYAGGSVSEASTSAPAVVTVTPAPLTITGNDATMTFGDPVPALSFTPTGFVNGDTAAVLSGSPQLSTTATSASPAGTYPIAVSTGTLTAANYSFVFVNGTLTINPATPTVTVTCPTLTYDAAPHGCTATAVGVGGALVNGTFAFTYNGSPTAPAAAGTYAVSASFTSGDPSYTNAAGTGTLTINPAVLTVAANNQSMIFGAPVPALTFTFTGFAGADTPAVVTGAPQLSTAATSASAAGSYPITVSIGTLAAANYTFTFVNGTLTILPATPVVAVSCPPGVVFDSSPHACTATAIGVGGAIVSGAFAITYNASSAAPMNAGNYTASAVFTSGDPNYNNASGTGLLVIAPAVPLVTVSCPVARFDHHRQACTATVSGVTGAPPAGILTITYNGNIQPPFAPGTYNVLASFLTLDPNYTNATGAGTLIIERGNSDGDDGDDDRRGRGDDQ
jgi:hypothetical protein